MMKRAITLLILVGLSYQAQGQLQEATASTKRKKVQIANYTLFLHLHDLAIEYSTDIDYKTDSLFEANEISYEKNIFDFRIRAMQSLQHVLYKSDPVVAFIDGWIFGVQMVDYLGTSDAREYLGFGHGTMVTIFKEYLEEFPESFLVLTGNDPTLMSSRLTAYAKEHPIADHHLNRTSIIDETAQWVGEATIGFKSGVATLTDAVRNISDRLNYHAEFTPKIVEWNVERTLGNVLGTDSIGPIFEQGIGSLDRITNRVDSIDHLVYSVTDTVLTDVNRQRWETLSFMRAERQAIMEQISTERVAIMAQLTEERKAIENLVAVERVAWFEQLAGAAENLRDYSFNRIDGLVDMIFIRLLILTGVAGVGLILAIVVYKKL